MGIWTRNGEYFEHTGFDASNNRAIDEYACADCGAIATSLHYDNASNDRGPFCVACLQDRRRADRTP